MELIGAEAVVTISKTILKNRLKKSYRIKEIDEKLRFERTKKEAKMLRESKRIGVKTPTILKTGKDFIEMEKINGKTVRESINENNLEQVCEQIGKNISKLHSNNLIHGDLTTSNLILSKNEVYFIDFGLGFESKRHEDKAVDLHVLEQALKAKHHRIAKKAFKKIIESYNPNDKNKILDRLEKLRKRGRYHESY